MNVRRELGDDDDPNIINAMDKDSRFNYMDSMEDKQEDPYVQKVKSESKNKILGDLSKIPECTSSMSDDQIENNNTNSSKNNSSEDKN